MNINNFFSSTDKEPENNQQNETNQFNSNLDPKKYRILREKRINSFLILKINYTDPFISDYESNKILVFRNHSLLDIVNQKNGILPYFSNSINFISPIARFKPDDEGWEMAVYFAENFK